MNKDVIKSGSDKHQSALYVEVLDAIMSSGKTSGIMRWFDEHPYEKYIYVTPLLDEAETRLTNPSYGCESTKFYSPEKEVYTYYDDDGNKHLASSKSKGLLRLLEEDKNISCTHALFMGCTKEVLQLISEKGYVVVLDEELDVISSLDQYSRADRNFLIQNDHIRISEVDGKVSWVSNVERGAFRYQEIKQLCEDGLLYASQRSSEMMVIQLPIDIILAAKRFIILTYLFEGSILHCYLQMNGVSVQPFIDVVPDESGIKDSLKALITFVGEDYTHKLRNDALSTTWYSLPNANLKMVERAIKSVCVAQGVKSTEVMYTFPKVYAFPIRANGKKIHPNGFRPESKIRGSKTDVGDSAINRCWVDCGCRATNELSHKTLMIHAHNRYPQQPVRVYLEDMGFPIDKDAFALAEMLQWLFRGCIRNKEPMKVCILSVRMRDLFKQWLNDEPINKGA